MESGNESNYWTIAHINLFGITLESTSAASYLHLFRRSGGRHFCMNLEYLRSGCGRPWRRGVVTVRGVPRREFMWILWLFWAGNDYNSNRQWVEERAANYHHFYCIMYFAVYILRHFFSLFCDLTILHEYNNIANEIHQCSLWPSCSRRSPKVKSKCSNLKERHPHQIFKPQSEYEIICNDLQ